MVQRYTNMNNYIMQKDDNGGWVSYDDYIAEVEKVCEWVDYTNMELAYPEEQWKAGCKLEKVSDYPKNYCPYCGGKIKIKE